MLGYKYAVEINGITKKYDGFTLDNISFNVPRGSIMGFIGQNGAGKTTTIKAMLGIIKPDKGRIKILGLDSIKDDTEIKERISAVFDELPFHEELTANNIGVILSSIYSKWDKQRYAAYLDRFCLPQKKKTGKFSKGMKMKLQIACALSHDPELLIMDEPTAGLDPVVRNEILDIFREYIEDENHSILMSSHITSDLEKISDSVTFIDKGRLLISGYKDEILESHGVIKCGKEEYRQIDKEDIISTRLSDFGAEVMVSDKEDCRQKYPGFVMDNTTLEEIMLFYVNEGKGEWR
ncbi:MAG: ABC transporter ATP-binding protein [Ruminococcus sp.]|nr:ABC transporter ATP-binding protein [Ruminococcus sp.]